MAPTCACEGRGGRGGAPARLVTVAPRLRLPGLRSRALDHLVAPQVVGVAGGGRELAAAAVVRPGEVLAALPGPVGLLAAPPRVDQVPVGALPRAQQLEPLEALRLLDRPAPPPEALLEALLLVLRHGDGIDLHDAH